MAEDCGWDGVFLEDYLVYQGDTSQPTYDAWISLAAMASATSTISLGTSVTPLPHRQPWQVAAQAVALDHLSGGRFILGVGLGDPSGPYPDRPSAPGQRLDEALTIIHALWTGEPVHHTGKHYRLDGIQLTARPLRRIPVWVGGDLLLPAVRRRIARADGSCAYKGPPGSDTPPLTPADIRDLLAEVSTVRGTLDGFDVRTSGITDPTAIPAFAEAGVTWTGRWVPPGDPATAHLIRQGPPQIV
jgi:alkanesulfonate monooxygenase SsuD/methylene tetrahydromethanopterin reductase-like flavin-dependent oxidoreductase (luciferase family)